MWPYIYWNTTGDFAKHPDWCTLGVRYNPAHFLVDSQGNVKRHYQWHDREYLLGARLPHYLVPALRKCAWCDKECLTCPLTDLKCLRFTASGFACVMARV